MMGYPAGYGVPTAPPPTQKKTKKQVHYLSVEDTDPESSEIAMDFIKQEVDYGIKKMDDMVTELKTQMKLCQGRIRRLNKEIEKALRKGDKFGVDSNRKSLAGEENLHKRYQSEVLACNIKMQKTRAMGATLFRVVQEKEFAIHAAELGKFYSDKECREILRKIAEHDDRFNTILENLQDYDEEQNENAGVDTIRDDDIEVEILNAQVEQEERKLQEKARLKQKKEDLMRRMQSLTEGKVAEPRDTTARSQTSVLPDTPSMEELRRRLQKMN